MVSTLSLRIAHWKLWLTAGVLFVLIGLILLSSPMIATFASVFAFGILLIVGSGVHMMSAILDRAANHFWLHLVMAVLSLAIGILMLIYPVITLASLTLLIATFFLTNGLFRIMGALVNRFTGWGWYILNGLISLLLAVLIILQWPASSFWVIGLFIGIDFLFAGITLIMIALSSKKSLPV